MSNLPIAPPSYSRRVRAGLLFLVANTFAYLFPYIVPPILFFLNVDRSRSADIAVSILFESVELLTLLPAILLLYFSAPPLSPKPLRALWLFLALLYIPIRATATTLSIYMISQIPTHIDTLADAAYYLRPRPLEGLSHLFTAAANFLFLIVLLGAWSFFSTLTRTRRAPFLRKAIAITLVLHSLTLLFSLILPYIQFDDLPPYILNLHALLQIAVHIAELALLLTCVYITRKPLPSPKPPPR